MSYLFELPRFKKPTNIHDWNERYPVQAGAFSMLKAVVIRYQFIAAQIPVLLLSAVKDQKKDPRENSLDPVAIHGDWTTIKNFVSADWKKIQIRAKKYEILFGEDPDLRSYASLCDSCSLDVGKIKAAHRSLENLTLALYQSGLACEDPRVAFNSLIGMLGRGHQLKPAVIARLHRKFILPLIEAAA